MTWSQASSNPSSGILFDNWPICRLRAMCRRIQVPGSDGRCVKRYQLWIDIWELAGRSGRCQNMAKPKPLCAPRSKNVTDISALVTDCGGDYRRLGCFVVTISSANKKLINFKVVGGWARTQMHWHWQRLGGEFGTEEVLGSCLTDRQVAPSLRRPDMNSTQPLSGCCRHIGFRYRLRGGIWEGGRTQEVLDRQVAPSLRIRPDMNRRHQLTTNLHPNRLLLCENGSTS